MNGSNPEYGSGATPHIIPEPRAAGSGLAWFDYALEMAQRLQEYAQSQVSPPPQQAYPAGPREYVQKLPPPRPSKPFDCYPRSGAEVLLGDEKGWAVFRTIQVKVDQNLAERLDFQRIFHECCGKTLKDEGNHPHYSRSFNKSAKLNANQLSKSTSQPGRLDALPGANLTIYCYESEGEEPYYTFPPSELPKDCLEKLLFIYLYQDANGDATAGRKLRAVAALLAISLHAFLRKEADPKSTDTDVDIVRRRLLTEALAAGVDLKCENLPEGWENFQYSHSLLNDRLAKLLSRAEEEVAQSVAGAMNKADHKVEREFELRAKYEYSQWKKLEQENPQKADEHRVRFMAYDMMKKLMGQANMLEEMNPGNSFSRKIREFLISDETLQTPGPAVKTGDLIRGARSFLDDETKLKVIRSNAEQYWLTYGTDYIDPNKLERYDYYSGQNDPAVDAALQQIAEGSGFFKYVREGLKIISPSSLIDDTRFWLTIGRDYLIIHSLLTIAAGALEFTTRLLTEPGRLSKDIADQFRARYEQFRARYGDKEAVSLATKTFLGDMVGLTSIAEAATQTDSFTGERLSGTEALERGMVGAGTLILTVLPVAKGAMRVGRFIRGFKSGPPTFPPKAAPRKPSTPKPPETVRPVETQKPAQAPAEPAKPVTPERPSYAEGTPVEQAAKAVKEDPTSGAKDVFEVIESERAASKPQPTQPTPQSQQVPQPTAPDQPAAQAGAAKPQQVLQPNLYADKWKTGKYGAYDKPNVPKNEWPLEGDYEIRQSENVRKVTNAEMEAERGVKTPEDFTLPKRPPKTISKRPTHGMVRDTPDGDLPLVSGSLEGPAAEIKTGDPLSTIFLDDAARSHVEGHAAALFHSYEGMKTMLLDINNAPCNFCFKNLSNLLPKGKVMFLRFPTGEIIRVASSVK